MTDTPHTRGRHFKQTPGEDPWAADETPQTQPANTEQQYSAPQETNPYAPRQFTQAPQGGLNPAQGDGNFGDAWMSNLGGGSDDGGHRHHHHHHHHHHRGRRIAAVVGGVVAALLVIAGICGALVYRDAMDVLGQSKSVMAQVSTVGDALKSGDGDSLVQTASQMASEVSGMRSKVDGPLWNVASALPVLGDDIRAARGVVEQADNLMQNALMPVAQSLQGVSLSTLLQDGTVDVQTLESVSAALSQAQPVVEQASSAIDALPQAHIGKVRDAVDKVRGPIASAAETLKGFNEIAPVLPQMLGASGTRNYLLVAQNLAELRSTGGLPGSMGVLTIDNGHISLNEFVPATSLDNEDGGHYGITDEEMAIWGKNDRLGKHICDTNLIPDFARDSQIWSEWWQDKKGSSVDGVIAIDPVLLQKLLALTGGIEVNGHTIDGTNAAKALLNDAYNEMPVEQTDQFFSDVAGQAFEHVMGSLGNVGVTDLMQTLGDAVGEQHLFAWMANADEQALVEKAGAAGTLVNDAANPQLGVFISDDTYSKKSWFFSTDTQVGSGVTNADGTVTYHMTTTLSNHLTADEAASSASYITGYNIDRRDNTDMVMWLYLVAPAGGSISNVSQEGGDIALQDFTELPYNGFNVTFANPRIDGGETMTVSYDVTCAAGSAPMTLRTTPTAQSVAGWE